MVSFRVFNWAVGLRLHSEYNRLTRQDLMNRVNMYNTETGRFNFLIFKSLVVGEYRQAKGPQCVVTWFRPSLGLVASCFQLAYTLD
jgi:hypothetical protein